MAGRDSDRCSALVAVLQGYATGAVTALIAAQAVFTAWPVSAPAIAGGLIAGVVCAVLTPALGRRAGYLLSVAGVVAAVDLFDRLRGGGAGAVVTVSLAGAATFAATASAPFVSGGRPLGWCAVAAGAFTGCTFLGDVLSLVFGNDAVWVACALFALLPALGTGWPRAELRSSSCEKEGVLRTALLTATIAVLVLAWWRVMHHFATTYRFRLDDGVVTGAVMAGLASGVCMGAWGSARRRGPSGAVALALGFGLLLVEFAYVRAFAEGDVAAALRPYLPFGLRHAMLKIPIGLMAFGLVSIPLGYVVAMVPHGANLKAAWAGVAIGLSALFTTDGFGFGAGPGACIGILTGSAMLAAALLAGRERVWRNTELTAAA